MRPYNQTINLCLTLIKYELLQLTYYVKIDRYIVYEFLTAKANFKFQYYKYK